MIGPFLNRNISHVQRELQAGESFGDFQTMYEIILENRPHYAEAGIQEVDEEIAIVSLCAMPFPGKPPPYRDAVRRFRFGFRGIEKDDYLKADFQSRLTRNLLFAKKPGDLDFSDIKNVFRV